MLIPIKKTVNFGHPCPKAVTIRDLTSENVQVQSIQIYQLYVPDTTLSNHKTNANGSEVRLKLIAAPT